MAVQPSLGSINSSQRLRADLILLSVSVIWGSAFVVQRIVAANNSVFLFNSFRFLLAGLVLLPILVIGRKSAAIPTASSRSTWSGVIIAGLLLTAGASFQQAGLRYTTAGNAGFITGLYVVLIPIIQAIFLRRSPQSHIWIAAIMAGIGLFLLSTGGQISLKVGDALELAGSVFWALHVLWIGRLAKQQNGLRIAVGQYLVCGLVSLGLALILEPGQLSNIQQAGWAIVYTGLISVGLGYTLQIYGQRVAPPADAAILLSMEAVFAALFGWIFLSEALTAIQLIGCGIMLGGMLLAQAGVYRSRGILLFFIIAWVLPTLACNFPALKQTNGKISDQEFIQTLVAQMDGTSQVGKLPEVTALPLATATAFPPVPIHPTPGNPVAGQPPLGATSSPGAIANYYTQPGDTLAALAKRFKIDPLQIISPDPLPTKGYLEPNQPIWIPVDAAALPTLPALFPDSEVIYSPTVIGFETDEFIRTGGGYLSQYKETIAGQEFTGAEIVERVARESSVNPRLLLAFLEYRSGWVFGPLRNNDQLDYPIGFRIPDRRGLYQELVMAATHLNIGYYGWRSGDLDKLKYADGRTTTINPWLNAGSVGVQNLFAKFYKPDQWQAALYGEQNFSGLYQELFGDPWQRAASSSPVITSNLVQPTLELPFASGERWSLTGGPHQSWNTGSPRGAIDFAPVTGEPVCSISRAWVTSASPGVVVRSRNNVVAVDLDSDGSEATGWVLVYLHIADQDRAPLGQFVKTDDHIGHPSCERGSSTGTHVHLARKYNGEWLDADGAVPFTLSGWRVEAGEKNYQGSLKKGDQQVSASPVGPRTSIIVR